MSKPPAFALAPVLAISVLTLGSLPVSPWGARAALADDAPHPWEGPREPGRFDDHGDRHGRHRGESGHDRARRAAERGEILTLAEILRRVGAEVPGRVLEAELEREHGVWVYELKILDPGGRLFEVYVDARDGSLLKGEDDR